MMTIPAIPAIPTWHTQSELLAAQLSATQTLPPTEAAPPLIPQPSSLSRHEGAFTLSPSTVIVADDAEARSAAEIFNSALQRRHGFRLRVLQGRGKQGAKSHVNAVVLNTIALHTDASSSHFSSARLSSSPLLQPSSSGTYTLLVTPERVSIRGVGAGVLYGLQTLLQLCYVCYAGRPDQKPAPISIPAVEIHDEPRFRWRGLHLDVARHFFPVPVVKRVIDLLAMFKMNVFHWHLTDDQGWRIEIKKHPRLTQQGAWRRGTLIGHYNDYDDEHPPRFDTTRYGGFYTQAEIRDVVEYARKRHITVVPEIEMPGHALAALSAYPELACDGASAKQFDTKRREAARIDVARFDVARSWGVFDDVFCPKPATFSLLEDVLTEVMDLFPSPVLHIGGDECPKTRWKACPHCQKLIKQEGLKDKHELQSYFIRRIEAFVASKGRSIIGWDEILEGERAAAPLSPSTAVMSWRGETGGLAAARARHNVVMSPTSHCYFDYYQSRSSHDSLAIGGYLPLEKVYGYEPIPTELPSEAHQYVLGAQANLWTEYIKTQGHLEYMLLPRLCALAEVVWSRGVSASQRRSEEAYSQFVERLQRLTPMLKADGFIYARSAFDPVIRPQAALSQVEQASQPLPTPPIPQNALMVEMYSPVRNGFITYTTDGSTPTAAAPRYTAPLVLQTSCTVQAAIFADEQPNDLHASTPRISNIVEQAFVVSKTSGKPITLVHEPHRSYNTGGAAALVDGVWGERRFKGVQWLGFEGADCEAVIDLQTAQRLTVLRVGFYVGEGLWIYAPRSIEVAVSEDGTQFTPLATQIPTERLPAQALPAGVTRAELRLGGITARFVRVRVQNYGRIPDGRQGAGNAAWLMVDEVSVE